VPTIFRIGKMRVMIYPNDHPPAHVHVVGGGKEARIIIDPEVQLDVAAGLSRVEVRAILEKVHDNWDLLTEYWNSTHGK